MIGELSAKIVTDIRVSNLKGNIRRFYHNIG